MSEHRPSPRVWGFATLALLLVYPLSFGPACWLKSRLGTGQSQTLNLVYAPVLWIHRRAPSTVRWGLLEYANLGCGKHSAYLVNEGVIEFW